MEVQWRYGMMGTADKFSGEDSGGQAWWQRCGTKWMDTADEEMRDGNRKMWNNGDG